MKTTDIRIMNLNADVIIIGAGIAGMATAARLQAAGLKTILLEAHGQPGGCAGFFRKAGFAFDVGATTLVDFEPGGVGGELLDSIGLTELDTDVLPGYVAWLPDRKVTLFRDPVRWSAERIESLGDSPAHQAFWRMLDQLARIFWQSSRAGVRLPMQSLADVFHNARTVTIAGFPLLRFMNWTMGDALRHFGLRDDLPLTGLLSMLIEDTVNSTLDEAPLINAALGVTIRGAGLSRHHGGMYGFWQRLVAQYKALGGELHVGCRVYQVEGQAGAFTVRTQRGRFQAAQVVSALPAALTSALAPPAVANALRPYLTRDQGHYGGAIVVFLGVPDEEVEGQSFTHHQLLQSYQTPLGWGNNMFISVSAADDHLSAPPGCRAVMISTHCDLETWEKLPLPAYEAQKQAIGDCLIDYARRVYPALGRHRIVYEIGTPRTYEKYTSRPGGAVGGVHQTRATANQHAIPYRLGLDGFWIVGDSTWPGLGTVACVLGSRHVVAEVHHLADRWSS